MKILVVLADSIQVNSSANLCHLAYIKGLLDSGHDVTLISASNDVRKIDPSIIIPEDVHLYTFSAISLYEKFALKMNQHSEPQLVSAEQNNAEQKSSFSNIRSTLVRKIKNFALSLYGPHGIYMPFVRKAQRFKSSIEYDYVLSLAFPTASHLLAHKLLSKKHIRAKKWIQIWEDPWNTCFHHVPTPKTYKAEYKLLSCAESICYVSPLTLKNQIQAFPEFASKMYWQPLPHYYKNENGANITFDKKVFGYFGDYNPSIRNLEPFYLAAKDENIHVNICGNPNNLFPQTERIHIYPRLSLDQLKPIEDNSNVLVFLCNRLGGQIPGKIYQYSSTNKIVLFILDGTDEEKQTLINFFKPFKRYVFCENTVEDIKKAIKIIENNQLNDINNEPLDAFNPKIIIQNILEGKSI